MESIDLIMRMVALVLILFGLGYSTRAYRHMDYERMKQSGHPRNWLATLTGRALFTPAGFRTYRIGMIIVTVGIVLQLAFIR